MVVRTAWPLGILLALLAAADARAIQSLCDTGSPLVEVTARFSKFSPSSDRERFRIAARVPTAGGSIDPVATGVRVLLAAAAPGVLLDETVPPGAYDATTRTGWRVGNGKWRFSRPGRVPNGTKRVTVIMAPGATSVVIEADGGICATRTFGGVAPCLTGRGVAYGTSAAPSCAGPPIESVFAGSAQLHQVLPRIVAGQDQQLERHVRATGVKKGYWMSV